MRLWSDPSCRNYAKLVQMIIQVLKVGYIWLCADLFD